VLRGGAFNNDATNVRCAIRNRNHPDDILLFGDDKRELWAWLAAVEARLASLRLTIHTGAHPRPIAEGFSFLGFRVFPHRRRLKSRKAIHFRRRLRRLAAAVAAGARDRRDLRASIQGWINHARWGNTVGLRKAVLRGLGP
jgi:hypothetical protein